MPKKAEQLDLPDQQSKVGVIDQNEALLKVLSEEGGVVIRPQENPINLPGDADYSGLEFANISSTELKLRLETLVKFVNTPLVKDRFGDDHAARRVWEHSIEERFGVEAAQIASNTRFSMAKLSIVFNTLEMLSAKLLIAERKGARHSIVGEIEVLRKQMSAWISGYNSFAYTDRYARVHEAEWIARRAIDLMLHANDTV